MTSVKYFSKWNFLAVNILLRDGVSLLEIGPGSSGHYNPNDFMIGAS